MDKLLALRMFIATVEARGFSSAARRLGLATSSVTRMVSALESQLETALLNRSTRQVTVTEAGAAYYQHACRILDDLADADALVRDSGDEPSGPLRVSVPAAFGRSQIGPHIGVFLARYPAIELDLTLTDSISDQFADSIDLSIRLGSVAPMDGVVSRTIGQFQRWVVASPAYLEQHGYPEQPQDLREHECLRSKSNNAEMLREIALADAGVALLSDWMVQQDVERQHLQRLFSSYQVTPNNASAIISALYLPNQRGSKRVNAFIDFIIDIVPH
ncbi:LysR family transcriptional regulator [Marinobacterium sedimentorum]|uniref:LysR family transcriptional regulator n=1 Tax=Marinobacterium sedimentorum TaxID=2927804 RepID=UPI0020C6502C|nr:LysR family transcriptional regulator [Marinobacterium sedimentorum]MCP8688733.1 LysR family transcriptional regulator [Marinobacterium sedimentorum]